MLVLAQAGVGKSSLAHSLALEFKKLKHLGGVFAFSKDHSPKNFFRTIARSLADIDPSHASLLAKAINSDSTLATTTSLSRQSDQLLRDLLDNVSCLGPLGPIIIIIDALDECPSDLSKIIELSGKSIISLPSHIRFLVTSRPTEAEANAGTQQRCRYLRSSLGAILISYHLFGIVSRWWTSSTKGISRVSQKMPRASSSMLPWCARKSSSLTQCCGAVARG